MKSKWYTAIMVIVVGVGVLAEEALRFSPEEVATALSSGAKANGGHRGLVLRDAGQGFVRDGRVGCEEQNASPSTGFWLEARRPCRGSSSRRRTAPNSSGR